MICEPLEGRRERIWRKVMDRVLVHLPTPGQKTGCWEWTGPTSGKKGPNREKGRGHGYARMTVDGATMAVHKVMWVILHGPVPPRKQLDHTCRLRLCVNPDHLEMVTCKVNAARREAAKPPKLALVA